MYQAYGEWAAAARAYEAAIDLDDHHPGWHFQLGRMRERSEEWAAAARAYEAAIDLDDDHPDWHFRLGRMRASCGEWAAAARAYEAAISLDRTRPEWFLALARVYERRHAWPSAVRAYEAANTADSTHPDWHFALGYAYERTSQWSAAVQAYEAAVAGNNRNELWLYRLGRARVLASSDESCRDRHRMAAYRTLGGDAVLRRLVAQHAAGPVEAAIITSEPLQGGSSITIKHTLGARAGTLPRHVVHKITTNRNEARAAQLVAGVELPPEISTPELLGVVDTDELVHMFFEFVAMHLGFDCSLESFERYGEIYARFARILPDDHGLAGLSPDGYSQESLRARLELIESLDAYRLALAHDGSVRTAFLAVDAQVGEIAAAAAAMPWVFSHNDAGIGNVMSRRDDNGRIKSIVVIDWGFAGLNLVGADLHHLLRHPGVSDDLIDALIRGYWRVAREYLPGLRADDVRFAANLYCFRRATELTRRRPITPVSIRYALTFGRAAAECAA